MSKRFIKLTRPNIRKLQPGGKITEHGITFVRLANGDGRYSVNVMVDGQRIHRVIGPESAGVTRKQCEDFIASVRTKARESRLGLPRGRKVSLTFRRAVEEYLRRLEEIGGKDIKAKGRRLRQHLVPFFGDKHLALLVTMDVQRYKKHRLEEGAAKGTINRELAALSHLFTKAVEWKWIAARPATIERFKEERGRIVYLTTEQIDRLLAAAREDECWWIYPFIVIGLETAMRRSEILSIRLEHIDLERRVIYIPEAKAGQREQPITSHLAEFLRGYLESAEEGQEWLFPSRASRSGHAENPEKPWRRVIARAGLSNEVKRHTLRHTAITHLVQAGVDLPTVQRISGHKTLAMVVRYSHQNGEHIRSAMDRLEERYRGGKRASFSGTFSQELHTAARWGGKLKP